ncbi:MAG: metallophosphoesterase [Caldilineaceae bacterium]|nr:metallophosphoesterase [Caldilineaceae bacterium]MBP8108642.1 metallophosphoesterase [Caldilineaceae bacterium]MBP8123221.1 metallophosphoesterase [Caldilineaceae bacterium]MBP9073276.1 metallophosphoesterase [Caldilineaceae bacterium]
MTQPSAASHSSKLTRRRFLQMMAGSVTLAGGGGFYTRFVEPGWLDVTQIPLVISGLAPTLAGLRMAQISDIHLSQHTSPQRLLDAVDAVNKLAPDLILITGDFVGGSAQFGPGLIDPLRQLTAPAFAILGNHDHWTGVERIGGYLAETPVTLLRNQGVSVADGLWLAGIDDVWAGRPDLSAAVRDAPAGATTLLMAHEPDYFDQVIAADAPVAVQFSGHSHGGQVRLPGIGAPVLPYLGQKYPIGLRAVGQRQVYTNRGLGVWPLPYRFNCRPEITLFVLEAPLLPG